MSFDTLSSERSTIHPVLGPDSTSGFPPLLFYRQSAASDLGAMAKRAGVRYLMLTHLIPPLGAERQGPWKIPGGGLTEADYRKAVETGGFTGTTHCRNRPREPAASIQVRMSAYGP